MGLTGTVKVDTDDEAIHRWSIHHRRQRRRREIIRRTTNAHTGEIKISLDGREPRRSEPSSLEHVNHVLVIDDFLKDTGECELVVPRESRGEADDGDVHHLCITRGCWLFIERLDVRVEVREKLDVAERQIRTSSRAFVVERTSVPPHDVPHLQ